jgi:ABC-type phosphate transport system auxiliary subunit
VLILNKPSKKTLKSRLTVQRKEFEGVVNRHLTFIDATIAEKNQLTQRCEALSEELKSLENSFKDKV